jgi:hypothetical protein
MSCCCCCCCFVVPDAALRLDRNFLWLAIFRGLEFHVLRVGYRTVFLFLFHVKTEWKCYVDGVVSGYSYFISSGLVQKAVRQLRVSPLCVAVWTTCWAVYSAGVDVATPSHKPFY